MVTLYKIYSRGNFLDTESRLEFIRGWSDGEIRVITYG